VKTDDVNIHAFVNIVVSAPGTFFSASSLSGHNHLDKLQMGTQKAFLMVSGFPAIPDQINLLRFGLPDNTNPGSFI